MTKPCSESFADLMLTSLIGCLLPVYSYSRAMSIFFGFGGCNRGRAGVMLVFPTLVWMGEGWRRGSDRIGPGEVALLLGAQLLLAIIVAAVIALIVKKRGGAGETDHE
jgi:hypothetical protein